MRCPSNQGRLNATQHWVLGTAYYSEHGGHNTYDRGTRAYPAALRYPEKRGGYPRAHVSYGKHANYASVAECNAGGALGIDECPGPLSYARVATAYYWNVGSSQHHFIDCVASRDPFYQGNGVYECFWSGARFSGWVGALPDCDPYALWLAQWEF